MFFLETTFERWVVGVRTAWPLCECNSSKSRCDEITELSIETEIQGMGRLVKGMCYLVFLASRKHMTGGFQLSRRYSAIPRHDSP
jgi:hypothetical protein